MQGWTRGEKIGDYSNLVNSLTTSEKVALYLVIGLIAFIMVGYILSVYVVAVHAKGLKLYLTVDTNIPTENVGIGTYQHGNKIYDHSGYINPGTNEITLQYPNDLVDNGPFQICVATWHNGQSCGDGYNGEEKKPETVFISLYGSEQRNSPNVESQDQSQSQNQDNNQEVTVINCPADSECIIK